MGWFGFTDLSDSSSVEVITKDYGDDTYQGNIYRSSDSSDTSNHDHEYSGNRWSVSDDSTDHGLVDRGHGHSDSYEDNTSYPGSGK